MSRRRCWKNCGGLRPALYSAFEKLGYYWRFGDLKSCWSTWRRGGAFIGEPDPRALSGEYERRSASSRRWLSVIYIDVNAVEDFRLSEEAQAWWQIPATQQKLRQARDAQWVNTLPLPR